MNEEKDKLLTAGEAAKILRVSYRSIVRYIEQDKLKEKLDLYIKEILSIASDMEPFLPKTSEIMQIIFSQDKIKKPDSIFPRK